MKHLKYLKRYETICHLIENEKSGTPSELSKKIGISKRALFHYLEDLRDGGMDIRYSRKRRTYYFNR